MKGRCHRCVVASRVSPRGFSRPPLRSVRRRHRQHHIHEGLRRCPWFVGLPPLPQPSGITRSLGASPPPPVRYFGRGLGLVQRTPTFAPHIFGPPPTYCAVAPPLQQQAALLHASPPAPTSVGAAVTIRPNTDVRRRVMLLADTPTITSPNLPQHRYNKHNPHM